MFQISMTLPKQNMMMIYFSSTVADIHHVTVVSRKTTSGINNTAFPDPSHVTIIWICIYRMTNPDYRSEYEYHSYLNSEFM
jgi:hypothetical protein